VELLAAVPLVLLAGAVALQLLVAGYALTLADGAAEAGALALAAGRPVGPATRGSLPGWASGRTAISVMGGEVTVRLSPPALLPGLGGRLDVVSSAFSRGPGR
jgi:hypothetical protein